MKHLCLALALGAACATDPPPPEEPGPPCDIEGSERFLPLVEGAQWTHETISLKSGTSSPKTQTVGAAEDMGGDKAGVIAFPLTTSKDNGTIITWQVDTGTAVVRHRQDDRAGNTHRDDVYEPSKGRLDETPERLVEGATYSDAYTLTSTNLTIGEVVLEDRIEDWTVARFGEEIETPAGTFCTMQVTRQRTTDGVLGRTKQYWFARGVGKVKERSANSREVLIDFSIPIVQ